MAWRLPARKTHRARLLIYEKSGNSIVLGRRNRCVLALRLSHWRSPFPSMTVALSRPRDRTPRDRCASDSPAPASNPSNPGAGGRSCLALPIEQLAGRASWSAHSGPSEQRFYMMKTRLSVRKCLHSVPVDTSYGFLRISVVPRARTAGGDTRGAGFNRANLNVASSCGLRRPEPHRPRTRQTLRTRK